MRKLNQREIEKLAHHHTDSRILILTLIPLALKPGA
jgi:hypothetical protein